MIGALWVFEGPGGGAAALAALPMVASSVLAEELLFRGVGLRYLRAVLDDRAAILISAVLFGAYHVVGSQNWGMGVVFQFLMPCLGGLLFAWAAVRSGGLALPIGLHLGGNWIQAAVVEFSDLQHRAASEPVHALWRVPLAVGDTQILFSPDLLPRLPYILAVGIAAAVTWRLLFSRRSQKASASTA